MPRSRPTSSASSSLMQDVPGAYPPVDYNEGTGFQSVAHAVHARRADYVRPKHVRIKVGTWNVASFKGTEKDIGAWFVEGKGVTEDLADLDISNEGKAEHHDQRHQARMESREDAGSQESHFKRKSTTIPRGDPGSLPGRHGIGLYVLGLQEVVDVNSFSEAVRPYADPSIADKWKDSVSSALPKGYQFVAEQQLIGLLLLIFAAPDVAEEIKSVSTTSVGTGVMGYMGNKGAVTARIVLGETTRLVFINSHLAAGADKASLERRNWDVSQIVSRTRFDPIADSMDLSQNTGEQIGDEDFAFWVGDLNYRLEGIPGDDVRRILMLHTRNEYDLSQRSALKIERELRANTESVKRRVEDRISMSSSESSPPSGRSSYDRQSLDTQDTAPTLVDEIEESSDPTSLQTTLSSLLPHDELRQQMAARKAFNDGWREGPVTFLPTYKYDAGTVGVFDSSEKKRAPSWCDRILYRTRRDRLAYEHKMTEEENARKRDEEMKANGTDQAAVDEDILYDYDPENDAADDYAYDENDDATPGEGVAITKEGFEDELHLEYYTAHQRVLSSDHKPLDAIFTLRYDAVVPSLKSKIHQEVARELDKNENETRPSVTVVVDKHHEDDIEKSDENPELFDGVFFGDVRWAKQKNRSLTIANTGHVQAKVSLIERPAGPGQPPGIAPKWINLQLNDRAHHSHDSNSHSVWLDPGESCNVDLQVRIWDTHIVHDLNRGLTTLDDVLVLRVEGGRDHFIPVRANWQDTSLGRGINKLIRIPEGGIRRWQSQRPDSSRTSTSSRPVSVASQDELSRVSSREGEDQDPVCSSAPRELFRLTEAIEELSARIIAEWDMMTAPAAPTAPRLSTSSSTSPDIKLEDHTTEPPPAPWLLHPAWPFAPGAWTCPDEPSDPDLWPDALSDALNALDTDAPLEPSMPPELPRLQRLYALCSLLITFLQAMPDGIIPSARWPELETQLLTMQKRDVPLEDQKNSLQEILMQEPPHSISFVLVTSMLRRVLEDVAMSTSSANAAAAADAAKSPSKSRSGVGVVRRMTGLGGKGGDANGSSASRPPPLSFSRETAADALAEVFAPGLVRVPEGGGKDGGNEKARMERDRRRRKLVGVFLDRG
ncbi:hypothetical protein MBLNU230_g2783t1 [Neophaeotheca triangularis]